MLKLHHIYLAFVSSCSLESSFHRNRLHIVPFIVWVLIHVVTWFLTLTLCHVLHNNIVKIRVFVHRLHLPCPWFSILQCALSRPYNLKWCGTNWKFYLLRWIAEKWLWQMNWTIESFRWGNNYGDCTSEFVWLSMPRTHNGEHWSYLCE